MAKFVSSNVDNVARLREMTTRTPQLSAQEMAAAFGTTVSSIPRHGLAAAKGFRT